MRFKINEVNKVVLTNLYNPENKSYTVIRNICITADDLTIDYILNIFYKTHFLLYLQKRVHTLSLYKNQL